MFRRSEVLSSVGVKQLTRRNIPKDFIFINATESTSNFAWQIVKDVSDARNAAIFRV
jgi:hypothetical protein